MWWFIRVRPACLLDGSTERWDWVVSDCLHNISFCHKAETFTSCNQGVMILPIRAQCSAVLVMLLALKPAWTPEFRYVVMSSVARWALSPAYLSQAPCHASGVSVSAAAMAWEVPQAVQAGLKVQDGCPRHRYSGTDGFSLCRRHCLCKSD